MTNSALQTKPQDLSPPVGDLEEFISRHDRAAELVAEGLRLLKEAIDTCPGWELKPALGKIRWYGDDIVSRYVPELQDAICRATWGALLDHSRLPTVMSANDIEALRKQIALAPPAITRETVTATFVNLFANRQDSFRKGLVDLFRDLCRAWRSNKAFAIGKRVVLDGAMTEYGWNSFSRRENQINDLMRIFMVLDGRDPGTLGRGDQLSSAVYEARRAKLTELENEYFDIRLFKNGNIHFHFLRQDLVDAVNRLIAEEYGRTLADDR